MTVIRSSGIQPGERRLNGQQTTGRDYRNLSPPVHAMISGDDVAVPMRDGVALLADVHRPAEPGRYKEQRSERDRRRYQEPRYPIGGRLIVEAQRRALLPFRSIGREHRYDVIDAACDPAAKIAGLKARCDSVCDDDLRQRVGQRALKTVPDLDAHPAFVWRDEQQQKTRPGAS